MDGHSPSYPPESGAFPPNPVRGLVKEVLQELSLQEDDLFVDLSCGDGHFAEAILGEVSLRWQIIGVQATPETLLTGTGHVGIRPVPMDLEAFARFPVRYHKAVLRRDPLAPNLPRGVLARLFHQLIPGGRLVVVTNVPGGDVPLPAAALRRWERAQASCDETVRALREVGFSTRSRAVHITCHTAAAECCAWVASRAWPVLEDIPEAELAAGLAELRERLGASPTVTWSARFDLVTGIKMGDTSTPGESRYGSEDPRAGRSFAR